MRLPDDDEIYDVDQTYLGPPGYYIGRLRYRMIAVAPVLVMVGLAAVYRSGIGFSLMSVALTVLIALRTSQWIVNKTNHERPIGVLVATFWHELTAVRRPTRGFRSQVRTVVGQRETRTPDDEPHGLAALMARTGR